MRLTKLQIRGFRCFGMEETVLSLCDTACLIGPNSSGKTSVMMALQRMFGSSRAERQVLPEDFHLAEGERLEDQASRSLRLVARIDFPELDSETEPAKLPDVAATFEQMIVDKPDGTPYVRIELCADWTDDGTVGGTVEEQINFISTASNNPDEIEKHRHKVDAADRALIRVLYVPAIRDPIKEVRATAGTALHRLLRAVNWSDATEKAIVDQLAKTRDCLGSDPAMRLIGAAIQTRWSALYHGKPFANVVLSPTGNTLDDVVKQTRAFFSADDDAPDLDVARLGDGLRSLFSLSFTASILDIEQQILAGDITETSSFDADRVRPPLLTLLCVEEPENHLSPQHLGRVIRELRSIAGRKNGQILISSHSPAVLSRISPTEIRYCRGNELSATSTIRELVLPEDGTEAFKYIREAVRAQPEVYFARLVLLGEGPSEQVVIPRFLRATEIDLDVEQVVVIPLGGRHVQHFWRLLNQLDVPHLTLLDLDLARKGGGWERMLYLYEQLQEFGAEINHFYGIEDDDGDITLLTEWEAKQVRDWEVDDDFRSCVLNLEEFGVFLSSPLDIDLLMLEAYPEAYQAAATTAPRIPKSDEGLAKYQLQATRVVLGDGVTPDTLPDDTYTKEQIDMFPWYRSLFLHTSKPSTHHYALLKITDKQLLKQRPMVLGKLIEACQHKLNLHDSSKEEE